jgi:hypothetical protein
MLNPDPFNPGNNFMGYLYFKKRDAGTPGRKYEHLLGLTADM